MSFIDTLRAAFKGGGGGVRVPLARSFFLALGRGV